MTQKLLASILALCLLSIAAPQTKAVPHVIYVDGSFLDVGYDFEGLQPVVVDTVSKLIRLKGCVKVTASQNTQSLRILCDSINGTPKTPTKWSIHRCLPNGGGMGGGQVSFAFEGFSAVHMPALDVTATQADFFELEFQATDVHFDGFPTTTPTEKSAVKVQKMWLPANFRCTLGDLPSTRVTKVNSFTVKQGDVDLNGDGKPDFVIPEGIELTIPVEDMPSYQEWFDATSAGTGGLKKLTIEYEDADGVAVLTLTVPVAIESLGFTDILQGTTATPGREVRVKTNAKGVLLVSPAAG